MFLHPREPGLPLPAHTDLVLQERLELSHFSVLVSKTSVSTYSTTEVLGVTDGTWTHNIQFHKLTTLTNWSTATYQNTLYTNHIGLLPRISSECTHIYQPLKKGKDLSLSLSMNQVNKLYIYSYMRGTQRTRLIQCSITMITYYYISHMVPFLVNLIVESILIYS